MLGFCTIFRPKKGTGPTHPKALVDDDAIADDGTEICNSIPVPERRAAHQECADEKARSRNEDEEVARGPHEVRGGCDGTRLSEGEGKRETGQKGGREDVSKPFIGAKQVPTLLPCAPCCVMMMMRWMSC